VRVAVLTNSLAATDVVGVHAGYAKYRKALLEGGVEVYEMKRIAGRELDRQRISWTGSSKASLHTKTVVVDRRWAFVGSMNLDPRSVNINTEMGALTDSPELAGQLAEQFSQTTSPEVSHRVRVDEKGKLAWHDREADRERVLHNEPDASASRRFVASLLRLLPIESQL
jgi:putative cardiolipin synthase